MLHRLTRTAIDHPRVVLALVLLATGVFAIGALRVRAEFGYRVLIGDDHPSIRRLDSLVSVFGGGIPILLSWRCDDGAPCEDVFGPAALDMAQNVVERLQPIEGVRSATGPSNATLIVPDGDGYALRRLVERGELATDASWLAERAASDSMWRTLVSDDRRVGAILIQPTDNKPSTNLRLVEAIEDTTAPYRNAGFEFHLNGDAAGSVLSGRDLARSMARVVPLTVLVIGTCLVLLLGNVVAALSALATMGVALVWTFGLLGWMGWPQDGILEVLAPLILVVGVCDSVHLIARFEIELGEGSHRAAILAAARDTGPACLVTTLTTGGALATFTASPLWTFGRFGIVSSFGVVACMILSFSLLPILLHRIRQPALTLARAGTPKSIRWENALAHILQLSGRRRAVYLGIVALVTGACGVGWIAHLRVDQDWTESFGEDSELVQSMRFVERHLRPVDTLEIDISLPPGDPLASPAVLEPLSHFVSSLRSIPGFGEITSVLDLIGRLNRILHDDDPRYERPGDTAAANAEILELLAFDDPSTLDSFASLDRSRVRISIEAPVQPHTLRGQTLQTVRSYATRELPADWKVAFTGEFGISYDWVEDVHRTQLRSFPLALALVFALSALSLRSATLAVAALVPTLIPIVLILGTMGWLGMSLDVGRAMIGVMILGIGVDDALHLLRHHRERRLLGDDVHTAILSAIRHTGRAIVTTSIALSLGFLTLTVSAWATISSFGFCVALAVLGALVSTLVVLPSLLLVFAPAQQQTSELAGPNVGRLV